MRNPIDLSLYLVLDANFCKSPQGMLETSLQAVKGGATVVQLRAPEWKKRRRMEAARLLVENLRPLGIPVIVDDDVDIALLSGADGVHVGQEDLSVEDARALLGPKAIIGLSVGGLDELPEANCPAVYLGVGPVFATSTKKDAGAAIGTCGLYQICEATDLPVVAIGGIGNSNAADVIRAGADGAAVVSAICAAANPEIAAAELKKTVEAAKA